MTISVMDIIYPFLLILRTYLINNLLGFISAKEKLNVMGLDYFKCKLPQIQEIKTRVMVRLK